MIFHSLEFALFFALLFPLYWLLPRRPQNLLLLVSSYLFYGYIHPWFLSLLVTSTLADYLLALSMRCLSWDSTNAGSRAWAPRWSRSLPWC